MIRGGEFSTDRGLVNASPVYDDKSDDWNDDAAADDGCNDDRHLGLLQDVGDGDLVRLGCSRV